MRQWGFREWWVQNVKEQHFTVDDERSKIFVACQTGKKEDQASNLQGGPMVRGRSYVDRDRRAAKRFTPRNDADAARKGRRRLKQAGRGAG